MDGFKQIEAAMGRPATMADLVRCIEGVVTECEDDDGAPLPDAREALAMARGLAERPSGHGVRELAAENERLMGELRRAETTIHAAWSALANFIFPANTTLAHAIVCVVERATKKPDGGRRHRMPEHVRAAYAEAAAASYGVTPEVVRAKKAERKAKAAAGASPLAVGDRLQHIRTGENAVVTDVRLTVTGTGYRWYVRVEITDGPTEGVGINWFCDDIAAEFRPVRAPFPRNETRTIGVDVVPYPDDEP